MELQYDLPLVIYTAAHKYARTWKRDETTWAALLSRLSETSRTGETCAEYKVMKKAERDQRKDIGGFVGGVLKDGRRKKENVLSRQIVTLDADNADDRFLPRVRELFQDRAWAVYSTHSHTPERPRLRLLIPLAQPVGPEAYQAVARRFADIVGIEAMDDTTYEPERLMYWPSTPQDGEYVFEHGDGPAADPEEVLATYRNWHDMSEWPTSRRETALTARAAKRQGDPLAKEGIIGDFCRAHPIEEAIATFLSDVYAPCAVPGRYTYIKGTTAGGLVIYDDRFAYSHHSTDPAGGRLCNAFDLVRIHRFGAMDDDADPDTPVNKLPSFRAMERFAEKDEATHAESVQHMRDDFDRAAEEKGEPKPDTSWMIGLDTDKKGRVLPTAPNCILILQNDPKLCGTFGRDDFAHRFMVRKDLPWRKVGLDRIWRDSDDACLRNYLAAWYGLSGRQIIDDALTEVMGQNAFHPVRDYLRRLVWDGTPRVATLFIDFLGAEDTEFNRGATVLFFKAAVARVIVPGTKFDQCLVLSGPQGIGKSTVLRLMGGPWYSDSLTSLQGKDAMEQLQGALVLELSEMQATSKAENDQIKAFISRTTDRFRVPYGRRTEEFPRQCVFAATTNDAVFLKDRTGGRRFWPVFCLGGGKLPLEALTPEMVDQIWAEVYVLYQKDKSLLLPRHLAETARELQEAHTEGSEKVGLIADYLDKKLPERWDDMDLYERREYLEKYGGEGEPEGTVERQKVCTLEIWCEVFGGTKQNFTNAGARELNGIMQSMAGWKNANSIQQFGNLYGKQRAFVRK